jgi:hypothetical protein
MDIGLFVTNNPFFGFSNMGKNIVITIPKSTPWETYRKELDAVRNGSSVMNFKVPVLPKLTEVGDRCYLVYDGQVVGWMKIAEIGTKDFVCGVTGNHWQGNFISRTGEMHYLKAKNKVLMKGFQGFRYASDKLSEMETEIKRVN